MSKLNLRDIERRSWRSTMGGGVIEIMFGVMMFAGAISYLVSDLGAPSAASTATLVVLHAVALLLMFRLRKRYVLPRIGRATFSTSRKRRLRRMTILLAVCVAATIALVVMTAIAGRTETSLLGPVSATPIVAVVAVVVLVPLGALAVFLDYPRFLLLGGLIVAAEAGLALLAKYGEPPHGRAIVYGTIGLISLVIGLITFARFLQRIPQPTQEVVDHGS
jgi:hypothetical protein